MLQQEDLFPEALAFCPLGCNSLNQGVFYPVARGTKVLVISNWRLCLQSKESVRLISFEIYFCFHSEEPWQSPGCAQPQLLLAGKVIVDVARRQRQSSNGEVLFCCFLEIRSTKEVKFQAFNFVECSSP